eukprot:TRINITY_DN75_c0_g1_i1.p2 TRINITY_DN75_c0_g1~~TRINITY_DN75_c0_g1_i1.p2  ORF type:complete len:388 (-),score=100.49 TRINITY_DN75_c0_g1_i1:2643-3806(-)
MKVKINNICAIEVNPSDTIWALKLKIYHESLRSVFPFPLPPDNQILHVSTRQIQAIDGEKTLEYYGIQDESSVHCIVKKRPAEIDFSIIVDIMRKKERRTLSIDNLCQTIGSKCVFDHFHEIKVIKLRRKVGWMDHQYHVAMRRNSADSRLIGQIIEHKHSLMSLDLSYTMIGDGGGVYIAEGMKKNDSVRNLMLQKCKIGLESARCIGEMLAMNMYLITIDLSENTTIGDEEVILIAEGLETNTSVEILDFTNCRITHEGVKQIAFALEKNASLKILLLWGNEKIGDEGISFVAEALKTNSSLVELDSGSCGIGVSGAKRIGEMLKKNTNLKKINLYDNGDIGDEGAMRIVEALEENASIEEISMLKCGISEALKRRKFKSIVCTM